VRRSSAQMSAVSTASIPNIFDLAGEGLDQFYANAEIAATQYRASGIECTATHVARAAQVSNLVELAATVRSTGVSSTVKRFVGNEVACVVLVLGLEAVGVDLDTTTPEQIAGFCSRFEVVLAAADKKTIRPFR
jgi:hypothetical protein